MHVPEMECDLERGVRTVLMAEPEVLLGIVFGSAASGGVGPESDLDVAVAGERPLGADIRMRLMDALAEISGRPIDLVDLRTAGVSLQQRILSEGRRMVEKDEALYPRLVTRMLVDVADFLPIRQRILAERRERWIGR